MSRVTLKQFTKVPNAGDAASLWLVTRVLRCEVVLSDDRPLDEPNLIAIGSILQWADEHSTIWGSGLLAEHIALTAKPRSVAAVRGPLTRNRLLAMGIDAPPIFGDPGILVSDYFDASVERAGVGIIPHYVDLDHPFVAAAQSVGARLIDPRWPLLKYLSDLSRCGLIISSSLHGLIFAHSFGIPAVWLRLSDKVHGAGFKFRDYYSSIGIDAPPLLTGADEYHRVIDQAALPRQEIDREALRGALLDHFENA